MEFDFRFWLPPSFSQLRFLPVAVFLLWDGRSLGSRGVSWQLPGVGLAAQRTPADSRCHCRCPTRNPATTHHPIYGSRSSIDIFTLRLRLRARPFPPHRRFSVLRFSFSATTSSCSKLRFGERVPISAVPLPGGWFLPEILNP